MNYSKLPLDYPDQAPSANISCAIIDSTLTWYGAVNYLANTRSEEYALRITNPAIAASLLDKVIGDESIFHGMTNT